MTFIVVFWTIVNVVGLVAALYIVRSDLVDYRVGKQIHLSHAMQYFLWSTLRAQLFRVFLLTIFTAVGLLVMIFEPPRPAWFGEVTQILLTVGAASVSVNTVLSAFEKKRLAAEFREEDDGRVHQGQ